MQSLRIFTTPLAAVQNCVPVLEMATTIQEYFMSFSVLPFITPRQNILANPYVNTTNTSFINYGRGGVTGYTNLGISNSLPAPVTSNARNTSSTSAVIGGVSSSFSGSSRNFGTATSTSSRPSKGSSSSSAGLIVAPYPNPPTPIANSEINISLASEEIDIVWGESESISVTVEGAGNFNGLVDLQVENLPEGVTASFANPSIFLSPGRSVESTQLILDTVEAATEFDPSDTVLEIVAVPQDPSVREKSDNLELNVQRKPGNFIPVLDRDTSLKWDSDSFGTIRSTVTQQGFNDRILNFYQGSQRINSSPISMSLYGVSDNQRAAYIVNKPKGINDHSFSVIDLGFDEAIGGSPGDALVFQRGVSASVYFSPDDTLMMTIGPANHHPAAAVAVLYDLANNGRTLGNSFFTSDWEKPILSEDTVTLPLDSGTSPTWSI